MKTTPRYLLISAIGLILICPRPAYAYIDPGMGLFVVQGIISAVLGALFVGRQFIARIFGRIFRRNASSHSAKSSSEINSAPTIEPESASREKTRVG